MCLGLRTEWLFLLDKPKNKKKSNQTKILQHYLFALFSLLLLSLFFSVLTSHLWLSTPFCFIQHLHLPHWFFFFRMVRPPKSAFPVSCVIKGCASLFFGFSLFFFFCKKTNKTKQSLSFLFPRFTHPLRFFYFIKTCSLSLKKSITVVFLLYRNAF